MTRVTFSDLFEYRVTFEDANWVNLAVRVGGTEEVEVEWMVGPIPSESIVHKHCQWGCLYLTLIGHAANEKHSIALLFL